MGLISPFRPFSPARRLALTLVPLLGAMTGVGSAAGTAAGTAVGTTVTLPADSSSIRVAMTENAGLDLIITANPTQLPAVSVAKGIDATGVTGTVKAVRFQQTPGSHSWKVDVGTSCAGGTGTTPWQQVATGAKTPTAVPAVSGGELKLCVGGTLSTWDQGALQGVYNGTGQARTVNVLPLETYVADTLTGESPSTWGTLGTLGPQERPWGFQELEAQAVAVRSYALADHYATYAQVCDLACQYYRGTTYRTANGIAAAADTAGQVLTMPTGEIASTEFSASTGGYTANKTETPGDPFTAVPDTGDAVHLPQATNPNHTWTATLPIATVAKAFPTEGATPVLTVTKRNGLGTFGGRVVTLTVSGNGHSQSVHVQTFLSDFGAKGVLSNFFADPVVTGATLKITGHGWGHGEGMGQWGALGYAVGTDNGHGNLTWQQIVGHYYQPATLTTLPTKSTPSTPDGGILGYWLAATNGAVYRFGAAATDGSMAGKPLNKPIVGMTATPSGGGYWLVASDGGIFTFGNATFHGSMGGKALNKPVVGIATDPATGGYWEVASDGGVFSFTAPFYGSMGGKPLNKPIVGMASTPTGGGYWMVASDGGIFAFGQATFHGSMGGTALNKPVVAMAVDPATGGYWMIASDGGVFNFTAPFDGSAVGTKAGPGAAVLVSGATGTGYVVVSGTGAVANFGNAPTFGSATVSASTPVVAAASSGPPAT